MRAARAVELINSAAFHPDYTLVARVFDFGGIEYLRDMLDELPPSLRPDYVEVEIRQRTYDSSNVTSYGQYRTAVTVAPRFHFDPTDLDEDGVLFAVLGKLDEHCNHENREFLRVRRDGRWTAPFHPHNASGRENWIKRGGRDSSNA